MILHQYIDRDTADVRDEHFLGDRLVNLAYAAPWEDDTWFFRALTSARLSRALAFFNYDLPFGSRRSGAARFARAIGLDPRECLDPLEELDTPRKMFERRLRYWTVRPMEGHPGAVVSPADARLLIGSFSEASTLFLKDKFFSYEELLGARNPDWRQAFHGGDFTIFRLTPDKYHYNHTPVAGTVLDYYEVEGGHHSCNPGPVVSVAVPFSKNRRVVTIIDTDRLHGTGVGLVAMIEIAALMIGRIAPCYSEREYDSPRSIKPGMFLLKGRPKSLFRPGSSTDVLVFQAGRVAFCPDLLRNQVRPDVRSRFSLGFGRPLAETDVKVRATVGFARENPSTTGPRRDE